MLLMHRTKNSLPLGVRERAIAVMQPILAELIDLALQAKHAHWNVKGSGFKPLHDLFDDLAEQAHESADLVAERIVQLGGTALGTLHEVTRGSALPAYPADLTDGMAHIDKLSDSLASLGRRLVEGIAQTDKEGDADTADILTEVSRDVDKLLWFLEAHLPEN